MYCPVISVTSNSHPMLKRLLFAISRLPWEILVSGRRPSCPLLRMNLFPERINPEFKLVFFGTGIEWHRGRKLNALEQESESIGINAIVGNN